MYDNEIKDKFVELRAAGKSFGDISQELGVVKSTLHRWEDERADDIARLRRIEWEEQEHRWGCNLEELMTELACSISDYEMRLRHFTDNLSNLSLRDTVMLLRESRREYFRLRAMLMGTAPRPRPQKPATSVTPDPRAKPRCETKPNSRGLTRPDPLDSTNPQPANAVHNPPSDPSVEPPSETKSNETERFQQNGTTQHRHTNDLRQPQPDSFHFPGVGGTSSSLPSRFYNLGTSDSGRRPESAVVKPHFSPQPSEDSNPSSADAVHDSGPPQSKIENPKSDPDDEFLGSIVVSPYECGAAVVLKTLEQEAAHRERLAGG